MSRFLEESLEKMLSSDDNVCFSEWAAELPTLTDQAIKDLESTLTAPDFRKVDPEMWE